MKNNQELTEAKLFEMPRLFGNQEKTKDDLLALYVTVIQDKPQFKYDPKRMILDFLPTKKELFENFLPKGEYSLDQSMNDFGKLTIGEHRFINFLKFTDFEESEIQSIFETFRQIGGGVNVPKAYEYSKHELYSFIRSLMPPIEFDITDEDLEGVPMLTSEDVENLCKEGDELHSLKSSNTDF